MEFKFRNYLLLFGVGLIFPFVSFAQNSSMSFGFVVKPIFSSTYFRTGPQLQDVKDTSGNNYSYRLAQSSGFIAGGLLRKSFTKNIALETGIQFVKRIYNLDITSDSTSFSGSSDFKIIGYEFPIQALVFVQLSREIWMNAALGTSIDMFPSDIETRGSYFINKTFRLSSLTVFNAGVVANIGAEYRTEKSGIIYIGSSYHRSFNDTYRSVIGYYQDVRSTPKSTASFNLKGDYLTVDLRYYFATDTKKKKK